MLWHFLALLALGTDAPPTPALFPFLAPLLRAEALHDELMDPREVRYVLDRPAEFADDLALLRRRYRDLADAPPLADSLRFPPREVSGDVLAFNRHYRAYLDGLLTVEHRHPLELQTAIDVSEAIYRVWGAIRDCRCEYYYVSTRRAALKWLRDELLGPEDYYLGRLPPAAPRWRFRER